MAVFISNGMYQLILFDIDGTMVNSEWAARLSLARLMKEELGIDADPETINFQFGVPGKDALRELGFPQPDVSDKKWVQFILENYDKVTLFPGIREVVETLYHQGFTLGMVTSKNRIEYANEFENRYGLDGFFSGYICADDTIRHKPAPDPILEYMKRYGGTPETTFYIGDTEHDAACARDAGVTFALATWGNRNSHGIRADYKPASPAELLDILLPPQ